MGENLTGAQGPGLHGQLRLYPHPGPWTSVGRGPGLHQADVGWGHRDQAERPAGQGARLVPVFLHIANGEPVKNPGALYPWLVGGKAETGTGRPTCFLRTFALGASKSELSLFTSEQSVGFSLPVSPSHTSPFRGVLLLDVLRRSGARSWNGLTRWPGAQPRHQQALGASACCADRRHTPLDSKLA